LNFRNKEKKKTFVKLINGPMEMLVIVPRHSGSSSFDKNATACMIGSKPAALLLSDLPVAADPWVVQLIPITFHILDDRMK